MNAVIWCQTNKLWFERVKSQQINWRQLYNLQDVSGLFVLLPWRCPPSETMSSSTCAPARLPHLLLWREQLRCNVWIPLWRRLWAEGGVESRLHLQPQLGGKCSRVCWCVQLHILRVLVVEEAQCSNVKIQYTTTINSTAFENVL